MKIKHLFLLSAALMFMGFYSCSKISPPGIDTEEGIGNIIKTINSIDLAQYSIKSVHAFESDKLSNELGHVLIHLTDSEGKKYSLSEHFGLNSKELNKGIQEVKELVTGRDKVLPNNKESKVNPASLNQANIKKWIDEAKTYIPEEYAFESVGSLMIKPDTNSDLTYNIALNVTEKGNSTKMEGRNIVTEYYEVRFEVDKDGNVTSLDI